MIVLGGGITPVLQTCDTDLNQHVKRDYVAHESAELIQQMQDGHVVPSYSPECCIDMMATVLINMNLHRDASKGYIKTGLTVPLEDGSQDQNIVREAGVFWRELDMRRKVDLTIAEVRGHLMYMPCSS